MSKQGIKNRRAKPGKPQPPPTPNRRQPPPPIKALQKLPKVVRD